jgi:butyryl-CoA dehydrogenase
MWQITEEQAAVWRWANEFAHNTLAPRVPENDRLARFDHELMGLMAEQGFFAAKLPTEYGGQGLDHVSYALITEAIASACSATRTLLSVQVSLVQTALLLHGSPAQKAEWLPRLGTGEVMGCFGLTEPNAGSDAGNQQTRAVPDGDDYLLTGQKVWISNGTIAHVAIIIAQTNPALGHKGMAAFLVDTKLPGFSTRKMDHKLGLKSSDTAELFLDAVRVPAAAMLGKVGDGFKVAMGCLDQGRFSVAAGGVGVMQGCLDCATQYANERHAFGQPIGEFQMIQQLIADMAADCEAGRFLVLRAAHLKDKGVRNTRETSMAKLFCAEAAIRASNSTVQIYGGYGFSEEYPAARFYRDARVLNLYEGTSQIQRLILAQDALGTRPANGSAAHLASPIDRLVQ